MPSERSACFDDVTLELLGSSKLTTDDAERTDVARTVAWGHLALGQDDDALNTMFEAFEVAPSECRAELEGELAALEVQVEEATSDVATRSRVVWRFPDAEPEARWWSDQLDNLIAGLEELRDGRRADATSDAAPPHGWSVPRRLALAERLATRHADGGDLADAWEHALPALEAAYPGLHLGPEVGLEPLGPDPRSGCWEFAHLMTGSAPARPPPGARARRSAGFVGGLKRRDGRRPRALATTRAAA